MCNFLIQIPFKNLFFFPYVCIVVGVSVCFYVHICHFIQTCSSYLCMPLCVYLIYSLVSDKLSKSTHNTMFIFVFPIFYTEEEEEEIKKNMVKTIYLFSFSSSRFQLSQNHSSNRIILYRLCNVCVNVCVIQFDVSLLTSCSYPSPYYNVHYSVNENDKTK